MKREPNLEKMTAAEDLVRRFLITSGLFWRYEYPVHLFDDGGRYRTWTPDFQLPDLDIYVEVVGDSSKRDYDFRRRIYALNCIKIIFVHIQSADWQQELRDGILAIEKNRSAVVKKLLGWA